LTSFLLDINILLGIVWSDQQAHSTVFPWFQEIGRNNFATCGITQSGFVRISASAKFSDHPVSIKEALHALSVLTEMPGHSFWKTEIGIREATTPFVDKLFGPLQLTDAYLLGMAVANDGILVTRDRGIAQLAGKRYAEHLLLLSDAATPSQSR
jgi:toxin-antitoxin system PIN domain toxin